MKLTTQVLIPRYDHTIETHQKGLIVGSCFATNIARKLKMGGLNIIENPQGVLYNPISIAKGVQQTYEGQAFTLNNLVQRDGLWHSFSHHGSFSHQDPEAVLLQINHSPLEKLDYIIITLGTAWVYERHGEVVANCHKFPDSEFRRHRISVDETIQALSKIRRSYPDTYILLTVSPIRHLRDGLSENSVSKATLCLACSDFCATDPKAAYFPAYEIMVDELRDYRFYAQDMLHPSPLAVEIIFSKFAEALLSGNAIQAIQMGEKHARAAAHIALH